MDESLNLLNYWYDLEFFSPFFPNSENAMIITSSTAKRNKLPWLTRTGNQKTYSYNVYLGKVMTQNLINLMLEAINSNDDVIERDNTPCCVCAFKVDNDGHYIENSFSVSRFIWAMSKIITAKTLSIPFRISELMNFNMNCNDDMIALFGVETPIKYDDLANSLQNVLDKLALNLESSTGLYIHIEPQILKREKKLSVTGTTDVKQRQGTQNQVDEEEKKSPLINPGTEMMPSFFATDIDMIRNKIQPHDKIRKYIEALINPAEVKTQIDIDVNQIKKWLEPERYPLGKWPSGNSPSLMQQLAINIAISDKDEAVNIFSINGPPGTGKTTLLKEIIAANVVKRALLLVEYDNPDNAFHKCLFNNPPNSFLESFYSLDHRLTKHGMIIASSNNKAVENISKELPLASELQNSKPLSPCFRIEDEDEIYFTQLATYITGNGQKCWGLITASLGKNSNIQDFKQKLWFNTEEQDQKINLQQIYNNIKPDWEQARKDYKEKYEEVLKYCNSIRLAVDHLQNHKEIVKKHSDAFDIMTQTEQQLESQNAKYNQELNKKQHIEQKYNMLSENYMLLNSKLPFFKRCFYFLFKKDPLIIEWNQAKQERNETASKFVYKKRILFETKTELTKKKEEYKKAEQHYNEKDIAYQESNKLIKKHKKCFGANYADGEFWLHIEKNELSQIACPWTNSEYDKLREELFYQALQLQKAFVLNSKKCKQNLRCLINVWNNYFTEEDKQLAYTDLLNTLLLLVPAVSTTFASVSSFLEHIRKDGLGLLIIDEAGQAAPQYALGALWRTQKAIVVGDPLQIEPFTTVPQELCKKFANEYSINANYRSPVISSQVLADQINPYGGFRTDSENREIWLGCPLVMHRRCIDPMFSLSNQIAYDNRMFKKSREPDHNTLLSIEKSIWIDIKGMEAGGKDHFVKEQGDVVANMILAAFDLEESQGGNIPDIYIISPFVTVANGMKNLLGKHLSNKYMHLFKNKELQNWLNESCGTIHTFQGKEANEVILMLGCDPNSGKEAANWAGLKPNILNVALTRAKYRIAIIGDSNVWKEIPYFKIAYEKLPKEAADTTAHPTM